MTLYAGSMGKVLAVVDTEEEGTRVKEIHERFEGTTVDVVVNNPREACERLVRGRYDAVVVNQAIWTPSQAIPLIQKKLPIPS